MERLTARLLVLASANPHKARELRDVLRGWAVEPLGPTEYPEETGSSFEENARVKARVGRALAPAEAWVAGEDSGLEVDALGGAPGLRSARFAGEDASDEANVRLLLERLDGVEEARREARYVSTLVALGPAGEEVVAVGVLDGRIATAPRGAEGFGYDPVFLPTGETRTVAELGNAWKARRSHRAQAAHALAARLGEPARRV